MTWVPPAHPSAVCTPCSSDTQPPSLLYSLKPHSLHTPVSMLASAGHPRSRMAPPAHQHLSCSPRSFPTCWHLSPPASPDPSAAHPCAQPTQLFPSGINPAHPCSLVPIPAGLGCLLRTSLSLLLSGAHPASLCPLLSTYIPFSLHV